MSEATTTPGTAAGSDPMLVRFLLEKFDRMVEVVSELDDETANARPAPAANSAYVVLTHCLGMMRYWSSTVNRDIRVPRDRAGEFTAAGPVAELVARAAEVRAAFLADCRATDLAAPPLAAPPPHRGEEVWIGTAGGVLLHVFEEICQHLGHIEIARDVLSNPA